MVPAVPDARAVRKAGSVRSTLQSFGLLLATLLLAVGAPGCEPRTTGAVKLMVRLPTERYTLANGLEVLLHTDHRVPYVRVLVRYDVGHKDDPPGRAGLAHLYEHLMFSAAKHIPPDDYLGVLERAGAKNFNGSTSKDETSYFETVPTAALDVALFLEAERMGFAREAITTAQLERERRIVREEYHQNTIDRPYGATYGFAIQALYPTDHPYFPSALDREFAAQVLSLDDVRTLGATYYVPNNATLVLVGDFDSDRIKSTIDRYFAALPAGTAPVPARKFVRPTAPRVFETRVAANVADQHVLLAWVLPAIDEDGFREHVMAAWLLSEQLWRRTKGRRAISLSPGVLSTECVIDLTVQGDVNEGLATFESVRDSLTATPDLPNWADQRSNVLASTLFDIESLEGRANKLADWQRDLGVADGAMTDMRAYQDLSLPRIQQALRTTFLRSTAAVLYVNPDGTAPVSGKVVQ